jgi:hypothetical protein
MLQDPNQQDKASRERGDLLHAPIYPLRTPHRGTCRSLKGRDARSAA